MNKAATVRGAGFENPDNASAGVTIPATSTATIPPAIATAGAIRSRIRLMRTRRTTPRLNQASQLNLGLSTARGLADVAQSFQIQDDLVGRLVR
jgi:hypothetical protein